VFSVIDDSAIQFPVRYDENLSTDRP